MQKKYLAKQLVRGKALLKVGDWVTPKNDLKKLGVIKQIDSMDKI